MKRVLSIKIFLGRAFLGRASLLVLLICHLSNPAWSYAAPPLSLQALVEEAKTGNPELKALKEKIKATRARADVEGRLDDPTLKVEMMELDLDRPLNISPGDSMLTRYTFSQMFPFPGKLPLKEKMAAIEASMAEAELRAKELEIISMVKEAYFDYAYLTESIRTAEEIKELLLRAANIAEARYSTGQVSQQDVIRVRVEATMLTGEIITLNLEKEVAGARLKSLLFRPQDSPLGEPEGLSKEKVSFGVDELIKTAIEKNPEISMLAAEAEIGERGVELAKKNYYPDFMVGVAPIQRDGRFDTFDFMFQLNIPLWRGKYQSQREEASANAALLRLRLQSEKNIKGLEVKAATVKVDAYARMIELFVTSLVPQVELSFESALRNYQSGRVDFLMLLDSERELKKTKLEYLKTLAEYRKMVAALERAVGEDF